jgi:hypothetical protein
LAELITSKYVRTLESRASRHKEVTTPVPFVDSDKTFGNMGFHTYWQTIDKPFVMAAESHRHDFPQFLYFLGGDGSNLLDLGGVIEFTLSEDGKKMEKHIITKATMIYIRPGLYHNPMVFKKVTKPILTGDLFFAAEYTRM